jgi:hypothetical protein
VPNYSYYSGTDLTIRTTSDKHLQNMRKLWEEPNAQPAAKLLKSFLRNFARYQTCYAKVGLEKAAASLHSRRRQSESSSAAVACLGSSLQVQGLWQDDEVADRNISRTSQHEHCRLGDIL